MSEAYFLFATAAIETAVVAIGIIGNVMSIIVFSRKTFRNNSISTYCIALAMVEFFTLVQLITDVYYLAYKKYLPNESDTFCKLLFSIGTYLGSIQPWILVAFSVDKLLSMRTRSIDLLKKKWFQWSIVAAIVLLHLAIYISIPIFIRIREIYPGYFNCDYSSISFYNINMIINIPDVFTIPIIIMMVSSILTIRKLFKSRNSVEKIGKLTKERKSRDHKYAITSMIFNAMFIVFKVPSIIFFTLFAFYSYYDVYFYTISLFLHYLNMSLSFFVHFMTNSLFRREFLSLFRFSRRKSGKIANVRIIRINQVSTS